MSSAPTLSDALIIWTGWKTANSPTRDESRLIATFGEDITRQILPRLRQLEAEFYSSDAYRVSPDLREMGERAAEQFRSGHPELSEEAIRALAWCYTFDWR